MSKKWSKKEDKEILKAIKKSPDNLHKAFVAVSRKTGRTVGACSTRWYEYVSKSDLADVSNICFAIVSNNKYAVNRKNPKNTLPKAKRKSLWKHITDFFSAIF